MFASPHCIPHTSLCFSAKSFLLDLSCLFSLSTTPFILDFRYNPPLSFLFWIFYISLRSSSSPGLLSILLPLPLLFFPLISFAVFSFISRSSICAQFMYFLVVSQHLLFLFFLLSSSILFRTSLFPVSILLRNRTLLLVILDFMLLILISPLIAACAAHFGALMILLIAVFSAFYNLSISSPFMSITSAPYRPLGSTTLFQNVFPIITRWQLFLMTEFVIRLILLIFSSFRSSSFGSLHSSCKWCYWCNYGVAAVGLLHLCILVAE